MHSTPLTLSVVTVDYFLKDHGSSREPLSSKTEFGIFGGMIPAIWGMEAIVFTSFVGNTSARGCANLGQDLITYMIEFHNCDDTEQFWHSGKFFS